MRFWLGALLFLLATFIAARLAFGDIVPARAAAVAPNDDATQALGRRAIDAFYRGDLAAFWQQCSESMRGHFGSIETVADFRSKVRAQLGHETTVASEQTERDGELRHYIRRAALDRTGSLVTVTIHFDKQDRISFFLIKPEPPAALAPSTKLDYRTKTALRLPFEGTWAVVWGGRTLAQNYHAANYEQRFAYDLLVVQGDTTHAGDGTRNGDYYCYGRPILAPGAGTVVAARNDVAENVPGHMNDHEIVGNHVIIDHGDGEFSFLAHMIPGSITVRAGDRVTAGQVLGKCGNSGHSSEPHLHYHLQTTASLFDGEGLPAQFTHYVADGKAVSSREPIQGQLIANAATK